MVTTVPSASRRRYRSERERGAALAEAAMVTPLFLLLVFGVFEFGLIYRDVLSASDAAANGARRGAVIGPRVPASGANADFEIIREVRNSLGSIPVEYVNRIVIFKAGPPGAGGAGSQVPLGCKTGDSIPGVCNVYDPANAFVAVEDGVNDYFDCDAGGRSCPWLPTSRSNGPTPNDIDYLGVWVKLNRPYVTGIFGDVFTYEAAAIMRLEAGPLNP